MKKDYWGNRNYQMTCGRCIYFLLKRSIIGRCKRHAPTNTGYPVVFVDEPGCGDFKLDEYVKEQEVKEELEATSDAETIPVKLDDLADVFENWEPTELNKTNKVKQKKKGKK